MLVIIKLNLQKFFQIENINTSRSLGMVKFLNKICTCIISEISNDLLMGSFLNGADLRVTVWISMIGLL